jgi:hypothetical protein
MLFFIDLVAPSPDYPPANIKGTHQAKNDPNPGIPHLEDDNPSNKEEYKSEEDPSDEILFGH